MSRMPVLFTGHGSPMNAIEENLHTKDWKEITGKIPKPKSIISVEDIINYRGLGQTAATERGAGCEDLGDPASSRAARRNRWIGEPLGEPPRMTTSSSCSRRPRSDN